MKVEYTVTADSLEEIKHICDLIEGLPPKVEQVQSIVRQQDAALVPDESTGSAAGNPDGGSLEAFEDWIESEIEMTNRLLHGYGRHSDKINLEELRVVKRLISTYKRQGAA